MILAWQCDSDIPGLRCAIGSLVLMHDLLIFFNDPPVSHGYQRYRQYDHELDLNFKSRFTVATVTLLLRLGWGHDSETRLID